MKTATLIEKVTIPGGDHVVMHGAKGVYKLSEPIEGYDGAKFDHVYVSSANVFGTPETYVFGCDEKGEVLNWSELPCSTKGDASHADVLSEAGYRIESGPPNGPAPEEGT